MSEPSKRILATGKYIRLVVRNGWEFAERMNLTGIVAIVPVTDDGRLVLTEQYREPVQRIVIELPAGLVGDTPGSENEPNSAAAARELFEETGYEAGQLSLLCEGPPSPGFGDEVVTFFLATGLRKTGAGGGVEHENIHVEAIPLGEVEEWIARRIQQGLAVDPKVYAGLYFAKERTSHK